MIDTTHTTENSSATDSGPLYGYIHLGFDELGNEHVYRTKDETVFVFKDGAPVDRIDLEARPLWHYERFVDDEGPGWHDYHPSVEADFGDPFWMFRGRGEE